MKNNLTKLLMVFIGVLFSMSTYAQSYLEDPKWGANPEERTANAYLFNFYKDAYNTKNYGDAVSYMHQIIEKAPKVSENIYIYGINIFRTKIMRATSIAEKNAVIDTLMYVYDKRLEHFGDHATRGASFIKAVKAKEYLRYRPADLEGITVLFEDAIIEAGSNAALDVVNLYFKAKVDGYVTDIVEAEDLMDIYNQFIPLFEKSTSDNAEVEREVFEGQFISSGVANCENLEILFKENLAASPDDIEMLTKVYSLLSKAGCRTPFYISVAEQYFVEKPEVQTAMILASVYESQKNTVKALEYLLGAVALADTNEAKLSLYLRIAGSYLTAGNASESASVAKQAIEVDETSAFAYIILAQSYAVASTKSCTEFDSQTVNWLAYDVLATARRKIAADDSQTDNINEQMAVYRSNYPNKEEGFFRGLSEGESYTVKCGWLNGSTTVRFSK